MFRLLITTALLLLCAIVIVSPNSLAQKKGKPHGRPPTPVEVSFVVEKQISGTVNLIGVTRALRYSVISSEVDAIVIRLDKKEGQSAKANETIVKLDKTPYRIKMRAVKASLAKAQASLDRAQIALRRAVKLFDEKIASQEIKQNAELDVKSAKAELALRNADMDKALLDLDRCEIRAPYDGYIARKLTEVGYRVKSGDDLFEFIDIHKIDVVVEAPERRILDFSLGKLVQVTLDAYPDKTFEGLITVISPKADMKTHAFSVRITVDNPERSIKAGMLARAKLNVEDEVKTLLIPRDAVVWRARKAIVYTLDDKGLVKSIVVSLGRQQGDMVEAKGEISEGLKLVVTGNEILRDGQPVRVVGEKR